MPPSPWFALLAQPSLIIPLSAGGRAPAVYDFLSCVPFGCFAGGMFTYDSELSLFSVLYDVGLPVAVGC